MNRSIRVILPNGRHFFLTTTALWLLDFNAAWTDIQNFIVMTLWLTYLNMPFYQGPLKLQARIRTDSSHVLSLQPFQNVLTFLHMNNYLNSTTLYKKVSPC